MSTPSPISPPILRTPTMKTSQNHTGKYSSIALAAHTEINFAWSGFESTTFGYTYWCSSSVMATMC